MKRFLINILTFIPIAAVLYMVFLIVFAKIVPLQYQKNMLSVKDHMTDRLIEAKTRKNVDILFLGSSHSYRGFDTRIFAKEGLDVFNFGSSAQTPIQTDYLLDKYLDSLKPKLVIYEVYPVTFTIDGLESTMNITTSEKMNTDLFAMIIEQKSIKAINTMMLTICDNIFDLRLIRRKKKDIERYVPGGYVEQKIKYFNKEARPTQALNFLESQFKSFESNLAQLKQRKINYILVQAPYPKSTYHAFTNLDDFDKRMSNYGPYYNFNKCMDLDDSLDFMDDSHLNHNGVVTFNKQLLDTLKTTHYKEIQKLATAQQFQ
jgi:hypothetical protein